MYNRLFHIVLCFHRYGFFLLLFLVFTFGLGFGNSFAVNLIKLLIQSS